MTAVLDRPAGPAATPEVEANRTTHVERNSALGTFTIRPAALRTLLSTDDISYYLNFRGSDGRIVLAAEARMINASTLQFSVGVLGQGSQGPGLFGGILLATTNGTFTVDYSSYGKTGTLTAVRTSF